MKNLLFCMLSCIFLFSCSKENLYEFKDLTGNRDYIYNITFYPEDTTGKIEFKIIKKQTNGYNQEITYPYAKTTGGNDDKYTFETAVKDYKRTGVSIFPEENIKAVMVNFYEVGSSDIYDNLIFQHFSESSHPLFIGYDFETKNKTIEYIEEN